MTKAEIFRAALKTDHDECDNEACFLDVLQELPKTMREELNEVVKMVLFTLNEQDLSKKEPMQAFADQLNIVNLAEFYISALLFKQFVAGVWAAGCHTGYRYRQLVERDEKSVSELERMVTEKAEDKAERKCHIPNITS